VLLLWLCCTRLRACVQGNNFIPGALPFYPTGNWSITVNGTLGVYEYLDNGWWVGRILGGVLLFSTSHLSPSARPQHRSVTTYALTPLLYLYNSSGLPYANEKVYAFGMTGERAS
jgi:hypothetical protein